MNRFFQSPAYQEAVARLEYALERKHQAALLTGSPGSGKSTLLKRWAQQLVRGGKVVPFLATAGTFEHDLLWELAIQLKAEVSLSATPAQLWFQLREQLTAYHLEQRQVVLIVDHAQEMAPEAADLLLGLARQQNATLTLVLAVDRDELDHFDRRLLKLAQLKIELEAWDTADVAQFAAVWQAEQHGAPSPLDQDSLAALAESSGGSPRVISQILDLSQLAMTDAPPGALTPETIYELREELL